MVGALTPGSVLNPVPARAATVVAYDMVNSSSLNLNSHTNAFAGAFSSAGDGFEKYQRGVSSSIPFSVLDDTLSVFPPDTLGIIGEANTDVFFGVTDTENADNSGPVSASWSFDISGTSALNLSIDMGAMGDFETTDVFQFSYAIDGGSATDVFSIAVDEAASVAYTLDSGTIVSLDDPLVADGVTLTNDLQTITAPLAGTGSELTVTLTVTADGGSEGFAFQNLVIIQSDPVAVPIAYDMVNSSSLNLNSHTNAFAGAFSSAGDGFEKYQRGVSSSIPFSVLDDSLSVFPPDTLGIIGEANTDVFFGVTDTENADNSGPVSASWSFDITGATDMTLSVDMGAMGDFETTDVFQFSYAIDGGSATDVFSIAVDEAASVVYTMDGGATVPLDDPLVADGVTLTNDLQTITAPLAGTGSELTVTLTATADGGSEGFVFQNLVISQAGSGPVEVPFGECFDGNESLISFIQGPTDSSAEEGVVHVVEGVVVGDFQGGDELGGFFLQEEDADSDGNAPTSEGIFVAEGSFDVDVGDVVRVKGEVDEAFGQTQLESVSEIAECVDQGGGASAQLVTLPTGDLEPYEGMLITVDQTLHVTDNFNWHRNGEATLSVGGVLDNPTNVVSPGPAAAILQDLNNRRTIGLDDGSNVRSPDLEPVPYISPDGTLRRGDTIPSLTGVLGYSFGTFEVHPTSSISFSRVNERVGPPDVGGRIQVAAFNVLNYFPTIDTGAPICGPLADQGCRGADTPEEFARQRAKIVDAIVDLDAEIIGLMEIENAADNTPEADLVAGLNAVAGAGMYDYVATPGGVGADAIRVALLYQPGAVTPVGSHAILDSSVDPTFNDDKNRAVLAQTFMENATGEVFTVAVNHLKSKGSACDDVGDPNANDGQGNCNGVRTAAAIAQAAWLAGDPTGSGDPDSIVIGDLNAYANEDPIVALESAGYTDLVEAFQGPGEYSFVFFGQDGYLDHALSSPTFTSQVAGAAFWHINADEPRGLDYNEESNQPSLYNPDEWRASDHDPVVVGIGDAGPPAPQVALEGLAEYLDDAWHGTSGADTQRLRQSARLLHKAAAAEYWVDEDHAATKKVFLNIKKAMSRVSKVSGVDVTDAVDGLLAAARELATTQVQLADDVGAGARRVAAAWASIAAGDAADDPNAAVQNYRKAWLRATRALESGATFGTYNLSLNRFNEGQLAANLATPDDQQAKTVAEIIQRTRPAAILLNEFDFDAAGISALWFQENYLGVSQSGAAPISYPYVYVAPSNTGIPSGFDFDNSGSVGGGNDAFGFGFFEGQYGMVVMSMYPIHYDAVRTFQHFLWKDMPGALLPDDPATSDPADWYSPEELDVFRLSSKSHWDVPVQVGGETVHFLVSHPTPPVFDGPEDRNGTRNHDEIRFWADYVDPASSGYIYDDAGGTGGLYEGATFVIAGDQNADPFDGDSVPGAAQQLLDHPGINTTLTPMSEGAVEAAAAQGGANDSHVGDPKYDTADFSDGAPGNLRVDYVLPSANTTMLDARVFWPVSADPLFPLVGNFPFPSSDHKLVHIRFSIG